MSVEEEISERRRIQNRLAQRRFRQRRQNMQKAAGGDGPLLGEPLAIIPSSIPNPDMLDLDLFLEDSVFQPIDWLASSGPNTRDAPPTRLDMDEFMGRLHACGLAEPHHKLVSDAPPSRAAGGEKTTARDATEAPSPCDGALSRALSAATTAVETLSSGPGPETDEAPRADNYGGAGRWIGLLHLAAYRGHGGVVQSLLKRNVACDERDSDGRTPLIYASMAGHADVAHILLAHGATLKDVDNRGRSALHWAVLARQEAPLRQLLAHIDGNTALVDTYDHEGRTPLIEAVDSGFLGAVEALLNSGASLTCRMPKPPQG